MTDPETNQGTAAPSPTDAARRAWTHAGDRRRAFAAYAIVAVVSLALGAAATLGAVRWLASQAQATAPAAASQPGEHTTHAAAPEGAAPTTGQPAGEHPTAAQGKAVYISPARQQLIGVRTAEVSHRALDTTIRTVGVLAYDETRVAQIHTKIAGWVERVSVDFVGKQVGRGQPLFTVYSPELVSTQNEYLLALKAQRQLGQSVFAETRAGAESLVAAARDRLKLWDVSEAQIEALERTAQPRRTLTLYSPFTGIVLERNAFAGQYITPETATFKIADLSTIWVIGQIFEYELAMVKLGQEAQVVFPYTPGSKTLKGKLTYIYPDVDPMTRRVKVRIEFRNPGLEFKPESYVTVLLTVSGGHQLAIPKEAVIDNGDKRYAILAHPNGYFEPREIEVGQPVDEYYPVLKGLEHGDTVVTSAQFLIDSETNLQAAMQAMAGMHGTIETGGGGQEGMEMPEQKAPAAKPSEGAPATAPTPPVDHSKHKE